MRKHSPYKKFLRQAIMSMTCNGQLHHYITRHSKSEDSCETQRTRGDALGMSKLAVLFFMLIFGCTISFVIGIYEYSFIPPRKKKANFQFQDYTKYKNAFSIVRSLIPQAQMDEKLKNDTEWILNKLQDVCKPHQNK